MPNSLRIAIAGIGTVGASLAQIILQNEESLTAQTGCTISLVALSARSRTKDRGFDTEPYVWFDDPVALAREAECDVFVELIGGEDGAALESVEVALSRGKHVVSANKALLAKHGSRLAKLAEEKGVSLGYEAAVAGGIPIIKSIKETLVGNKISRVYGIMNGTCNYILTRMEEDRLSFEDCLKDAQALGYAEADPTFDIGGHDTAHKLALLTSLSFGVEADFDAVYLEGISHISLADIDAAAALGYKIKLLGVAQKTATGIEQRVHPTMVAANSAIADINGVTNAVAVDADRVGSILLSGPGAGGDATASSVIADIADIARGIHTPAFGRPAASLAPSKREPMRAHSGGYYVSLLVPDRPGSLATIAGRMADKGISLKSVVQHDKTSTKPVSGDAVQTIVIITHDTTELAVRDVLKSIKADGHSVGTPKMIRIETFG